MQWTDTYLIAIALIEKYPDVEPLGLRFTDLFQYVCDLEGFVGAKNHCNEKVLEAIQMAWLAEV